MIGVCSSLLTLVGCVSSGAIDADLLDQHDLVWELPPERWLQGIPMANGDIGALVWGNGAPLKVTLDKYDAWETREVPLNITYKELRKLVEEGKRKEAEQAMRTEAIYGDKPYPTRLPMPRLEIDFGKPLEWGSARLRLRTATTEIVGTVDGKTLRLETYVHANENLLVVQMEGESAAKAAIRLTMDHLNDSAKATLKKWGYAEPDVESGENGGSLRFRSPTGYEYAVAWRRIIDGSKVTVNVCILSSDYAPNPLDAVRGRMTGVEANRASHEAWWADYWKRSWLTVPDARLEALYYIEMYKLACSSRPGKWPLTLQGLWTLDGGMPPWSGDYHLDMNVQQSYWPIYTANRLDLGEPLYRVFSECLPRWQKQCQEFFGVDGIWSGCAIGPRGERIYGYSGVELWPGNVAWLAHHYWLHFLYSQDKQFLRTQALPIMRMAFLTYANLLEKGDDGKLHVPLSYSPEWGEGGFDAYCRDPNCDLALIRFLAQALLKTNDILGVTDSLTHSYEQVLDQLVDYRTRGNQLLISENTPLSHSHRHHSHLMAIHPLGLLSPEGSEQERALVRESLREIRVQGTGQWTGWAFPWMSLIASRAGYGNTAWQMLDVYANSFITPNTFHINGDPRIFGLSLFDYEPMTLEAGFGAAAAIMEMLLQSNGGLIRVFPTIPDRWHDAYFEDLRTEGAFLVTSKLVGGEVVFLRVKSEVGGRCRIKSPFGNDEVALTVDGGPEKKALESNDGVVSFDTSPGKSYAVCRTSRTFSEEDSRPLRFTRSENALQFYGVKKLPRF